ncbi:MAG: hypothetical protein IKK76_00420 [Alphaproteobacteria bacterium]|nr:hypothetical protein [Alphaproteobacteria bacterium]
MKYRSIWLCMMILPQMVRADTYNYDPRRYIGSVNGMDYDSAARHRTIKWADAKYNQIVRIYSNGGAGTGIFISPKHVLTNKHVAECCGVTNIAYNDECTVTTANGDVYTATLIATGTDDKDNPAIRNDNQADPYVSLRQHCDVKEADTGYTIDGRDWAIIELTDPDNYRNASDIQIKYTTSTTAGPVNFRAGFSSLRVLSDEDIRHIRTAYRFAFLFNRYVDLHDTFEYFDESTLKYYQIQSPSDDLKAAIKYFESFSDKYRELAGKYFWEDCLNDSKNLKIMENCRLISQNTYYDDNRWEETCAGWAGDSGSALVRNDKIVCLHNSGDRRIATAKEKRQYDTLDDFPRYCIPTEYIFTDKIQQILDDAMNAANTPQQPTPTQTKNPPTTPKGAQQVVVTPEPEQPKQPEPEQPKQPEPVVTTPETPSVSTPELMSASDRRQANTKTAAIATGATLLAGAAIVAGAVTATNNAPNNTNPKKTVVTQGTNQSGARIIGNACNSKDLPAFATYGIYAAVNITAHKCNGDKNCACVATKCNSGYSLVHKQINGEWESMGYCIKPRPCNTGTADTDVVNGVAIIRQHGNKFCK